MLATIISSGLVGIDASRVDVEVDVSGGLPGYHVVGMPSPSVKESGVRIRAALESAGQTLPQAKITVNLAPADQRKSGSGYDLPIALALLVAEHDYPPSILADILVVGELGLDGSIRPVRGVLASAMLAKALGLRGVLVPEGNAAEARLVDDLPVYAARHLGELVAVLQGRAGLPRAAAGARTTPRGSQLDMDEVRGQAMARLAIEVAVAGGHNILLTGPPGIGKTMLAQRIPTILPPPTRDEALEAIQVYSAVGLPHEHLLTSRAFRAPHHTISSAALLGGGPQPRPGEISLAHQGVLFLDELPEFPRMCIEALRQPLEDRQITIGRVGGTLRLPASFLLVAAANPCPCGWLGSGLKTCVCGPGALERYRSRLSGPILDRIDLRVGVEPISLRELRSQSPTESSAAIRGRVEAARARQAHRLASWGASCNAAMTTRAARATCPLDDASERALAELVKRQPTMSGRAVDRLIRVARTIADLLDHAAIEAGDLIEAALYRRALGEVTPGPGRYQPPAAATL